MPLDSPPLPADKLVVGEALHTANWNWPGDRVYGQCIGQTKTDPGYCAACLQKFNDNRGLSNHLYPGGKNGDVKQSRVQTCIKNELLRARRGMKRKRAILDVMDAGSTLCQLVAAVDPKFFDVPKGLNLVDIAWANPLPPLSGY